MRLFKNKKGFAFVEMVVACGVLAVTLAVAGLGANEVKTSINQTKAEAVARDIYVNAQSKLTMIKASGNSKALADTSKMLEDFGYVPEQYHGNDSSVRYMYSNNGSADQLYDSKENGGSWVIEFDPDAGVVIGVFWSSDPEPTTIQKFFNNKDKSEALRKGDEQTLVEFVKENGQNLAYYGNEVTVNSTKKKNILVTTEDPTPDDPPFEPKPDEPDNDIRSGFGYYEIYSDGTVGYYNIYDLETGEIHPGKISNTLDDTKTVVGDGYAVGVKKQFDASGKEIQSKYVYADFRADGSTMVEVSSSSPNLFYESQQGYLYALPTSYVDNINPANFYTRIGLWVKDTKVANYAGDGVLVNPYVIYTNLRLSKDGVCVGKGNTNPIESNGGQVPEECYIRTARQLYDLSLYYAKSSSSLDGIVFLVDRDIDYVAYNWATYSTVSGGLKPSQQPIGHGAFSSSTTIKNCFSSIFKSSDPNKVRTINGLNINGIKGEYCGLFSALKDYPYRINNKLVDSGIVENINLTNTVLNANGAKSIGGITGILYKDSSNVARVTNCSGYSPLIGKTK